jgi:hypothetical protein
MIVALLLTSAFLATWFSYWVVRSMRELDDRTCRTVSLVGPILFAAILYLGLAFFLGTSGIDLILTASLNTPRGSEFLALILLVAAFLSGLSILTAIALGKLRRSKST